MQKIAFAASFLAAFIVMDSEFFNGEVTRQLWSDVHYLARKADSQFVRWMNHR